MTLLLQRENEHIRNAFSVAAMIALLMLLVHIVFLIFPVPKYNWSIYPRDPGQWYGIITGQFIHASWGHLFSNLPPLIITTFVLFYFYRSIGWASYFLILCATGLMVFVLGRNYSHIGASGLVYGLIAFVFFSGIFRRNVKSIALMGVMVIMYSGYLAGFFPTEERVSWESHLFGAIAGGWTAFVFRNFREPDEKQQVLEDDITHRGNRQTEFFFPRDVFEKTLEQRRKEAEEAERKAAEEDQANLNL